MGSARVIAQLVAKMPARVGLLADVAGGLRAANVDIRAISAYERGEGTFLLVTDDNARASEVLSGMGAEVRERSVLAVSMPDRPGALEEAARRIAEAGINIDYAYGTTTSGAETATVILKTDDDEKAAGLL
ncbi:MAG: ACT domain-containing protein [Coriobacteriia bacterium]|nr:ACT domain-containing protein [Coriobacteriia bacterium]